MVDLQCLMTITLTVHLVLQYNSTNDISSHDGPHVASGQQSVTSSTAPPKIAATFNIHSSCGACQIDDTLVVKVAQVCF